MKSFMLEQSHQVLQEGQLGRPPVNGPGQLLRGTAAQCRDQFLVNVPHIAFQVLLGLLQGAATGLAGEVHLPAMDGRDVGGLDVGSMPNLPRQRAELRVRRKIHHSVRQRPQKVIGQPPRVPPRLHPLSNLQRREFSANHESRITVVVAPPAAPPAPRAPSGRTRHPLSAPPCAAEGDPPSPRARYSTRSSGRPPAPSPRLDRTKTRLLRWSA